MTLIEGAAAPYKQGWFVEKSSATVWLNDQLQEGYIIHTASIHPIGSFDYPTFYYFLRYAPAAAEKMIAECNAALKIDIEIYKEE